MTLTAVSTPPGPLPVLKSRTSRSTGARFGSFCQIRSCVSRCEILHLGQVSDHASLTGYDPPHVGVQLARKVSYRHEGMRKGPGWAYHLRTEGSCQRKKSSSLRSQSSAHQIGSSCYSPELPGRERYIAEVFVFCFDRDLEEVYSTHSKCHFP